MIIYALLKTSFGIVNGIIALFPAGNPPAFLTQISPVLHSVFASINGLSAWFPWTLAIGTASAVFGVWAVLMVISGVRFLLGWIPTMGGS